MNQPMRALAAVAGPALLLASLAACSQNARNETAEAGEAVGADANATAREAVKDVDQAADAALGSAEQSIDSTGNAVDRTADATGNVLTDAGNSIKD